MATVVADMSMTLDGFVADPDDRVDHVFAWLGKGQHTATPHGDTDDFRVDEASAEELRAGFDQVGVLIAGRRLFDLAHGWGGQHPAGVPVYVVTHSAPEAWPHPEAPFAFVTDGVVGQRGRASQGHRGRQDRRGRQAQHRPAVPGPRAARRRPHQPWCRSCSVAASATSTTCATPRSCSATTPASCAAWE